MKERPILFSAPMVRAILDGRKTQTRRVIKPQPTIDRSGNFCWNGSNFGQDFNGPRVQSIASPIPSSRTKRVLCPFGKPGDRLWVRETWGVGSRPDPWGGYDGIEYRADLAWLEEGDDLHCHKVTTPDEVCLGDYRSGWKPSIHMPRWASRINLEITGVRVERLNDISESDAVAEGCVTVCMTPTGEGNGSAIWGPDGYAGLWESINGYGSWAENPWVWVVSFRRLP